uniref:peptidylprolyl isomerase n=1 Tax=Fusarium oxysporum (strain Fo5176) TaxID=660025 RepID=A0A0D2X8W9_FUSOF
MRRTLMRRLTVALATPSRPRSRGRLLPSRNFLSLPRRNLMRRWRMLSPTARPRARRRLPRRMRMRMTTPMMTARRVPILRTLSSALSILKETTSNPSISLSTMARRFSLSLLVLIPSTSPETTSWTMMRMRTMRTRMTTIFLPMSLNTPSRVRRATREEAPKLVSVQKGKNKRAAEEATEGLDELISKDDAKLSKKQQKKLKNNKGEAVATEEKKDAKKVQFAKNLEQGPTGSAEKAKQGKATTGVKVVQGVTIDDRTIGNGRTVKNGDTVGVRYIGKLQNGKQFDANKKGKPFSFKAGKGQVIKGWDIGVIGMAIGGERRLTIPAHLAYGSRGLPGIPANSTLIFDVKLLEIK